MFSDGRSIEFHHLLRLGPNRSFTGQTPPRVLGPIDSADLGRFFRGLGMVGLGVQRGIFH